MSKKEWQLDLIDDQQAPKQQNTTATSTKAELIKTITGKLWQANKETISKVLSILS